jgi:hypothetical protein
MLFLVETKPALRGEGTDVLYVIRDVNGRVEGWKDGWMGKVRLGGCGEEAVVGLRGGGKGGGIGDRGWGTGLDLQL